MKEIVINGIDGYIKIHYKLQQIEIVSANFKAKGELVIDKKEIFKIRNEFETCINCDNNKHYQVRYNFKNDIFGFELRCHGEEDIVFLLGMYCEDKYNYHRIEFGFDIKKETIKKIILDIDNSFVEKL